MHHHLNQAALQQLIHNSTSWLGHRTSDQKKIVAGQTFVANKDGLLEQIEVFSDMVTLPGNVTLSLYEFDAASQQWGDRMGSVNLSVNHAYSNQWMSFLMPGLSLQKGKAYGFQLESNDTFIGLGEATGSAFQPPFISGKEWRFIVAENAIDQFSYFSLAFKVGMKGD